jgi:hypothetical protein
MGTTVSTEAVEQRPGIAGYLLFACLPCPEAPASKARVVGTDKPQCEGVAEKTSGNSRNSISETTSPTAR